MKPSFVVAAARTLRSASVKHLAPVFKLSVKPYVRQKDPRASFGVVDPHSVFQEWMDAHHHATPFYESLFDAVDLDGNGWIDKEEFFNMCNRLRPNELKAIAEHFDVRVTWAKTYEVLPSAPRFPSSVSARSSIMMPFYHSLFHAVDTDGNGWIDKREFFAMCLKIRSNELCAIAQNFDVQAAWAEAHEVIPALCLHGGDYNGALRSLGPAVVH